MNLVLHEKTLKILLQSEGGKPYAGNYVYSRDEDDSTYKIGMSQSGLFSRIKQAKSCYPYKDEFWLHYCIISLDGYFKKGEKSSTRHIEDDLLKTSKSLSTVELQKSDIKEQGQRPREYRLVSNKKQLYTLLKNTLNKHRDKWDWLVVFSKNGWDVIPNDRLVSKPITNITQLKQKSDTYTTRPSIYSMPLNNTKLIFPKDMKVGDVISSDNWKPFTVVKIINKKHIVGKFKGDKKEYDIKI